MFKINKSVGKLLATPGRNVQVKTKAGDDSEGLVEIIIERRITPEYMKKRRAFQIPGIISRRKRMSQIKLYLSPVTAWLLQGALNAALDEAGITNQQDPPPAT